MQIRDFMTRKADYIHFDKSVTVAAEMMAAGNYGALPVEKNDRLVGMITDRDIAVKVVGRGKDPHKVQVAECMHEGIDYIYDDQSLDDASALMARTGHRRLPVMSRKKKLVGIISLGDLACHEKPLSATHETLRSICQMVSSYADTHPRNKNRDGRYDLDGASFAEGKVVIGSDLRRW